MKVAVIGGGAAGLVAAGEAAMYGAEVTLFEHNERLGKKLVITGKGRCNLTNLCDVNEFLSNVAVNPQFLYSALNYFTPHDTMRFFEELGVELKVERGRRVFPASDKSFDIVDALRKFVNINRVKILYEKVSDIIIENNKITGLRTEKRDYLFDSVVICTGGVSYPSTGSTGDGYIFGRKAGHNIIPPKPSLVPLEIKERFCSDLMGLSLKNVLVSLYENKNNNSEKKIFYEMGEMIFTHFGISGPLVLSLSSHIRDTGGISEDKYIVKIDLKPALNEQQLDKRILSDFAENINKSYKNALNQLLPQKLIPVIVKLSEINPEAKVNEITKIERLRLVYSLKNFKLTVKKFRPIDEAIITSGGIDVKEIIPNRMESKLVKGLFFAGEVIDVDAYTGGYNLQIAFSTGKLAGKHSANFS